MSFETPQTGSGLKEKKSNLKMLKALHISQNLIFWFILI